MQLKAIITALVGAAMVVDAADARRSPILSALERRQNRQGGNRQGGNRQGGNNGGNGGNNGGNGLQLSQNVVQQGSAQNGNNPGSADQAASATSNNNFINFCQGKTLTNGAQVRGGSCNGIPMGNIPATTKMVSSIFVNPQNGDNIAAKQDFDIQVQMINFAPGAFTNATTTYYSAPQDLNQDGFIIGHTHVTVQDTGRTLNPQAPLDPQKFAFFKGINDAGNGRGLLSAKVTGGLPAGNYRLCSMSSSANHQPVLMPVAQRGAQDDCVRFTVGGNGNNNNNNNNGGNRNGQQNNGQQNNGQQNNGQQNNGQQNNGQQNNGQGNRNGQQQGGQQQGGQQRGGQQQAGQQQAGQQQAGQQQAGQQQGGQQRGGQQQAGQQQGGQQQGGQQRGGQQQAGQQQAGQQQGGQQRGGQQQGGQQQGGQQRGGQQNNGQVNNGQQGQGNANAGGQGNNANAGAGGAGGRGGASKAAALGGVAAPEISQTNDKSRPFGVAGNSFTTKGDAVQRSCETQRAACQSGVQSGAVQGVEASACDTQMAQCISELS
ncbi:hypothetical protein V2A60_010152 [Cordyceps javanica]|uniref:Ribosomal protein s17 n=1 Tax=Cordyceps javanica TaxID=43265 RepID=A0A545VU24_9HYPO|nr:ribosomal protein s17 [Cordyceps javanica]TQW05217.1 ribosomal protein s17 [Cordyceps javanica]